MVDHAYNTFKYFCQTNEYNGNLWLLLMTINKVGKENDGLRDHNSLLKHK